VPYFYTDRTRLSLRELWRFSRGPIRFFIAAASKLLGSRPPIRYAVRYDDMTHVIDREEIPLAALRVIEPVIADCERLGARLAFFQTVPAVGNVQTFGAVLFGPRRHTLIGVVWSQARLTARGAERSGCACVSRLDDGAIVSTTNLPQRFNSPPEFQISRLANASAAELLGYHEQTLATCERPAIPMGDERELAQLLDDVRRRNFEWNVARGVWVPLSDEAVAQLGLHQRED